MRKTIRKIYKTVFRNRFIIPLIEIKPANIGSYIIFWRDYFKYRQLTNKFPLYLQPRLGEKTSKTLFDSHYFYQSIWTVKKIQASKPLEHVDVGSQVDLVGFLTTITNVKFVDIRPLDATLDKLTNVKGNISNLPFQDNTIKSLSCLHVAEHIGLGRYGDLLDPMGTEKACRELIRVLAPGGQLYFSVPIGKEETYFNAHRVHLPETIIKYFNGLKLIEFSAVTDQGQLIYDANPELFHNAKYSCGLFHFTKPK